MVPSSPEVSARMGRVRSRHTAPEVALRQELHRRGLRYRVDRRPAPGVIGRADVVVGPARVAVYVDGCFWHSCPTHASIPRTNREWWIAKLNRNRERDRETSQALRDEGWEVIRIWEHENPREAADRIERVVRARRD